MTARSRALAVAAALAILVTAVLSLHNVALFASPLLDGPGPDSDEALISRFTSYPGAFETITDVLDLGDLTIGPYRQVYTTTAEFDYGLVTQSLESELREADGLWVGPISYHGDPRAAVQVSQFVSSPVGWHLDAYYSREMANELAALEPSDKLLSHWGEEFFAVRGVTVTPLGPEARTIFPVTGTLTDYQQMVMSELCPGKTCGGGGADHLVDTKSASGPEEVSVALRGPSNLATVGEARRSVVWTLGALVLVGSASLIGVAVMRRKGTGS